MHETVLLREAVEALVTARDGVYVDGTFGRGGHAQRILDGLAADGRLVAFDRDPAAVEFARQRFAADSRFTIIHDSFASLATVAQERGWVGRIDGLLLDLGVSSPQLDDPQRGFSFSVDGPLDMRMDSSDGQTAASWLATADEAEIADVLHRFGEERFARRIARAIVERRAQGAVDSTRELAELVARVSPTRERHKHPATRTFQAIRIFINRELGELLDALRSAIDVLAIGARLVVISFHSLEDRIVKRFMRDEARGPQLPKGLPVMHEQTRGRLKIVGGAIKPSPGEVAENPRARSAVMRVAEVMG
jgi:16S rRNA (cytosine1402-N4)-methyltransferase